MIKRPLCVLSLFLLGIVTVLAGELQDSKKQEFSRLEKSAVPGEDTAISGTVYKREEKEHVQAFYIKNIRISGKCKTQIIEESKILVYLKPNISKKQVKIGNQVYVQGAAEVFETARNRGNFDTRFYYCRQGIHALLWADSIEVISADTAAVREKLTALKYRWKNSLIEILGGYYGNGVSAVLLGEKAGLDESMKEEFRKTGIGHILAISGLHMSFIGMGLYKILRRLGLPFAVSGAVSAVFMLLYTMMTGAGISSIRALLMFAIRMGAEVSGRQYDMATSLSLAAAIVAVSSPLSVLDASFLLSFGSLAGLLLLLPILEKGLISGGEEKRKVQVRVKKHCLRGLCASAAVNLALLGPMLYFYFEIPPYSIFLNMLIIPLMPLFMSAGLLGSGLLLFAKSAGKKVLFLCKGILFFYDRACTLAGRLPGSRVVTGRPPQIYMLLYYVVLAGICIWFYNKKDRDRKQSTDEQAEKDRQRKRAWKAVGGFAAAAFILPAACMCSHRIKTGMEIVVLDVGQGDGIFIRGPKGKRYLIDGGSSDVSMVGKYRIEPYLLSGAVDTLDYILISHGDEDHINGTKELLERQKIGVRIKNLVLPPEQVWDEKLTDLAQMAVQNDTKVLVMGKGDRLTEGKMKIVCLHPDQEYDQEKGNEASMVLDISYKNLDILLTGDIEGQSEQTLVKEEIRGTYEILKVAHHGSKGSSGQRFLEQVDPEIALISAGIENRYGHPHEEVLKRLKTQGSRVYSTQDNGAITIESDGQSIRIQGYVK
ncbi:ComEC/Rec2 family competence protein [Mediterraneibacter sp. ICN-202921]|jgi:ComEC/Rec2-related protein|uniref:ComEC/Rec2 family competence protein n=1 Tax=Mediterraneibacter sp. ICN-202921 TaxID=3134657 RepID=UPI0030C1E93B